MLQPGHHNNMVTIYAAQSYLLQPAVNYTVERARNEIHKFIQLSHILGANCEQELTDYITELKDWLRGYQGWVDYDKQRYSSTFAKQDTDNREILEVSGKVNKNI